MNERARSPGTTAPDPLREASPDVDDKKSCGGRAVDSTRSPWELEGVGAGEGSRGGAVCAKAEGGGTGGAASGAAEVTAW